MRGAKRDEGGLAGFKGDETGEEGDDDGEHKKGVKDKFREWRQHEKELHKDHRGIMQAKPMRTAKWVLDNVEDRIHSAKDRFKMKSREPDVETEV